jgi:ATP-dependent Clp protease ATP-binding subunit ClpX
MDNQELKYSISQQNKRVLNLLSDRVYGHSRAKQVLVNCVNRSKLRYFQKWHKEVDSDQLIKTSNCLLIGASGTGKTHLVDVLSETMEFPLLRIDATELTHTSAVGGIKKSGLLSKIETTASDYLNDYKGERDFVFSIDGVLDQVVVFVDEIDKLGFDSQGDWNKSTQSMFLKIFENKDKYSGITFIFAGAFTGLEKKSKGSIGFNKQQDQSEPDLHEQIIKFGLIPELVGRINNIVSLDSLSVDDYINIFVKFLVPDAAKLLEDYGIADFTVEPEEIKSIAEKAFSSGLGVRYLQSKLSSIVERYEFDPSSYPTRLLLK